MKDTKLPQKPSGYWRYTTKEEHVMSERIRVLLTEQEVDARIQEIADKINRDYEGREVHMICVLKGGVFLCVNWQNA